MLKNITFCIGTFDTKKNVKLVLKYNPELDLELKVNIKSEPNLDKKKVNLDPERCCNHQYCQFLVSQVIFVAFIFILYPKVLDLGTQIRLFRKFST